MPAVRGIGAHRADLGEARWPHAFARHRDERAVDRGRRRSRRTRRCAAATARVPSGRRGRSSRERRRSRASTCSRHRARRDLGVEHHLDARELERRIQSSGAAIDSRIRNADSPAPTSVRSASQSSASGVSGSAPNTDTSGWKRRARPLASAKTACGPPSACHTGFRSGSTMTVTAARSCAAPRTSRRARDAPFPTSTATGRRSGRRGCSRPPPSGTECSQSRCARPPSTNRSPPAGERSYSAPPCAAIHLSRRSRRRSNHGRRGAERQDHDERVLGEAHVAVAVERLAVVAVSVPDEREAVEGHAVLRLDRALRLEQHGMRDRLPGAVSVRDARFLDPTLVAPEPARRPRHRVASVSYASGASAIQPRAMSTHVPSSSHWRSNATSRSTWAGPVSELTCGRVPTAQGRAAPKSARLRTWNTRSSSRSRRARATSTRWTTTASAIWLDRTLFTAMQYPADYGFFPDTLAEDGDPLDALVLLPEPTFPGCHIMIRAGRGVLDERREGPGREGAVRPRARPALGQRERSPRRPGAPPARDRALLRLLQDDRAREGFGDARLGRRDRRRNRHRRRRRPPRFRRQS